MKWFSVILTVVIVTLCDSRFKADSETNCLNHIIYYMSHQDLLDVLMIKYPVKLWSSMQLSQKCILPIILAFIFNLVTIN